MQPANSRAPAPRSPSPGCRVIRGVGDTGTAPPDTALPPPGPPAPRFPPPGSRRRRRAGRSRRKGRPRSAPGDPPAASQPPSPAAAAGREGEEGRAFPAPGGGLLPPPQQEGAEDGDEGCRERRLEALDAAAHRSQPSRSLRPRPGSPSPAGSALCAALPREMLLPSPPGGLLQGYPEPIPARPDPRETGTAHGNCPPRCAL